MNGSDASRYYFVDDRADASVPATRLRNVLDALQQGRPLSALALKYLQQQGLAALHRFAQGESTYESFSTSAQAEQAKRVAAAENDRVAQQAARLIEEAAYRAREQAKRAKFEAERRARETDPRYLAKIAGQQLRARYDVDGYIEEALFARLMDLLRRVDGGGRLTDDDVLWLTTEAEAYFSKALRSVFHEREANFFATEFERTCDPWDAINASGHYRKCDQADRAHSLLTSIPLASQGTPKIKSAICTTHGGVMRDLGRVDEALQLGTDAHALTPKDFRPCTLLGAVCIESGDVATGMEWYRKAESRGAASRSVDHELRGIFSRVDNEKREQLKSILLREDPIRFAWAIGLTAGKAFGKNGSRSVAGS